MLTDLVQIRMLGDKKRPENEKFRKHLKSHGYSERIMRRIAEDVESQIDCRECGNCCRVATTKLNKRDVENLAAYFRLKPAEFLAKYTISSDDEGVILKRSRETGCVFLDGKLCSIYEARPETCQKFPHVVRGNGTIGSRMWEFIDRATYCPIVYNSLEAFKVENKFRG